MDWIAKKDLLLHKHSTHHHLLVFHNNGAKCIPNICAAGMHKRMHAMKFVLRLILVFKNFIHNQSILGWRVGQFYADCVRECSVDMVWIINQWFCLRNPEIRWISKLRIFKDSFQIYDVPNIQEFIWWDWSDFMEFSLFWANFDSIKKIPSSKKKINFYSVNVAQAQLHKFSSLFVQTMRIPGLFEFNCGHSRCKVFIDAPFASQQIRNDHCVMRYWVRNQRWNSLWNSKLVRISI